MSRFPYQNNNNHNRIGGLAEHHNLLDTAPEFEQWPAYPVPLVDDIMNSTNITAGNEINEGEFTPQLFQGQPTHMNTDSQRFVNIENGNIAPHF